MKISVFLLTIICFITILPKAFAEETAKETKRRFSNCCQERDDSYWQREDKLAWCQCNNGSILADPCSKISCEQLRLSDLKKFLKESSKIIGKKITIKEEDAPLQFSSSPQGLPSESRRDKHTLDYYYREIGGEYFVSKLVVTKGKQETENFCSGEIIIDGEAYIEYGGSELRYDKIYIHQPVVVSCKTVFINGQEYCPKAKECFDEYRQQRGDDPLYDVLIRYYENFADL